MPRTQSQNVEPTTTIAPEIISDNETTLTETTEAGNALIKDEFADTSFIDANARLPRIQALRGTVPDKCGYFISTEEMAKAGWLDFDSVADQLTTYQYESTGNEAQGLLLQAPRLVVCPRSDLLAYDRKVSQESEQLVILGHWKREYKEDDNVGNLQMYEVILLSKDNQPLHSVPLSYIARGANGATFSQHWQQLCQEITVCHSIVNGIAARPKDTRFKSLCVFQFQTRRELVGKKQKSPTCRVIAHEVPTFQNWRNYFLGYDTSLKAQIWEGLQPTLPQILPAETLVLPPTDETE